VAGWRSHPALLRALDQADEDTRRTIWGCLERDPDEDIVEAAVRWLPRLSEGPQRAAFRIVTSYPCAASTAFLESMITARHAYSRSGAIAALLQRGNPLALKAAQDDFRNLRGDARFSAAFVLALYSDPDDAMVQVLVEGIGKCEERLRPALARPLVQHHRPEAMALLLDALRLKEEVLSDVPKALAQYPKGTFDAGLRAMAVEKAVGARRGAARGLSTVEVPDRPRIFRKLLEDPDDSVRLEAVIAFGKAPLTGVPPELEARLGDPSDDVRAAAVEVIGRRDIHVFERKAGALLSDPASAVREKSAQAVGRCGNLLPQEIVEKLLVDRDRHVRSAAASAIGALNIHRCGDKLLRLSMEDPSPGVRYSAVRALMDMGHERGLETMRGLAAEKDSGFLGDALITLMEASDRPSVGAALGYVTHSPPLSQEGYRTLLAMNSFTQPDLYRKCKETTVDFRGWKGADRDRFQHLAKAMSLSVAIDAHVPNFSIGDPWHNVTEIGVADELADLTSLLDAAVVLEPDCIRVMRRRDALDHWRQWNGEKK